VVTNAERLETARLQRASDESSPYIAHMRQKMVERVKQNAKRALDALNAFKAMVEDESTPPIKLVKQCAAVLATASRLVREEEDYLSLLLVNLSYTAAEYILITTLTKCPNAQQADWKRLEQELKSLAALLRFTWVNTRPILVRLLSAVTALRTARSWECDTFDRTPINAMIDAVTNLVRAYRAYTVLRYRLRNAQLAAEIEKVLDSAADGIISALCETYNHIRSCLSVSSSCT